MQAYVDVRLCPKCNRALTSGEPECRLCGPAQKPRRPSPESIFWRVSVGIVLAIGAIVFGLVVYLNNLLAHSGSYTDSIKIALASPEVQALLGSGAHTKYPALGHIIPFGDSRFAEWTVRLEGASGSGRLHGVANEINGIWDFSRVTFTSDNGRNRVDLTPVRRLGLPLVPTQAVYLIPIGLEKNESLEWAPAYYMSKLGIDVKLLPASPLDNQLIDQRRDQLNSDRAVEFLQKKYPGLANDPFAILIGVTSRDMYIPSYNWRYAENMRTGGRLAIVSSARLHPPILLDQLNPDWLASRLQKLLTKNVVLLYYSLPMSDDDTSLLSGGVLSGLEIDHIGGQIVGVDGRWKPFVESGGPCITIYDVSGKEPLWRQEYIDSPLSDTSTQVFSASLLAGLLVQRKTDFLFSDDAALTFSRVHRNQDDRSRAFGIGGSHPFDMFLGGKMGIAVDLIAEDGTRIHYVHQEPKRGQEGDVYQADWGAEDRYANTQAVFVRGGWQIKTTDGWTYFFPYQPQAMPQYVTVLTSFMDPSQRRYEMERDSFGALLSVTSPSGKWLHFENDAEHRIRKVTASSGRSMTYEYDNGGYLARATDSDGNVDTYTYDDKGGMLTAAHGDDHPVLTNRYSNDGYIKSETMKDGRQFSYFYFRDGNIIRENEITDPNGLTTYVQYVGNGYLESLPAPTRQELRKKRP